MAMGGGGVSMVTLRSLHLSYNNQLDVDQEKEGERERWGDDGGGEWDKGAIMSERGRSQRGGS
jgi:hypothetical protein